MFLTSLRIIYRASWKWSENNGTRASAALAYYGIFAAAPLLLIAIYFSAMIYGEDAAHQRLHGQLSNIVGDTVARSIEDFIDIARTSQSTWGTPIFGFALLAIAAISAFVHVRNSFSIIWRLDPPEGTTWLGMLWDYVLALVMVICTVVLILCTLAASLAVPIAQRMMQAAHLPTDMGWQWIEWGASFGFLTVLFGLIYRILSGGRISWGYVLYGSLITAVLFTIGKSVLSYYIVYSGTETMYGAAGSIVVFMMWVYYSALILFFGAELIQARRTRHEWMTEPPLAA